LLDDLVAYVLGDVHITIRKSPQPL